MINPKAMRAMDKASEIFDREDCPFIIIFQDLREQASCFRSKWIMENEEHFANHIAYEMEKHPTLKRLIFRALAVNEQITNEYLDSRHENEVEIL